MFLISLVQLRYCSAKFNLISESFSLSPSQSLPWHLIYQVDLKFFRVGNFKKYKVAWLFFAPYFFTPYFGPYFFQGRKPTHVFKTRIMGADRLGNCLSLFQNSQAASVSQSVLLKDWTQGTEEEERAHTEIFQDTSRLHAQFSDTGKLILKNIRNTQKKTRHTQFELSL